MTSKTNSGTPFEGARAFRNGHEWVWRGGGWKYVPPAARRSSTTSSIGEFIRSPLGQVVTGLVVGGAVNALGSVVSGASARNLARATSAPAPSGGYLAYNFGGSPRHGTAGHGASVLGALASSLGASASGRGANGTATVNTYPTGSMWHEEAVRHPSTGHQNGTRVSHSGVYQGTYSNGGVYTYDPNGVTVIADSDPGGSASGRGANGTATVNTYPAGSMWSEQATHHASTGTQNGTRVSHGGRYQGTYSNGGVYTYDPNGVTVFPPNA